MRKHAVLTIKNKSEIIFLNLDSILYFQADGNYCNVYFADGSVLSTLTYQRAEIARMMDDQLREDVRKEFMLLGKSYLINKAYVLRIQPSRQLLTFRVNRFGTTKKISIKATTSALNLLIKQIEEFPSGEE